MGKGSRCSRKALNGTRFCLQHTESSQLSPRKGKKPITTSLPKKERKVATKELPKSKVGKSIALFEANSDQSWDNLAQELIEHGVTVIVDTWLTDHIEEYQDKWDQMYDEWVEYKDTSRPVLGGFMALGNPSSFHHPLPRRIRQWAMWYLVPLFKAYLSKNKKFKKYKLESIIDRIMDRSPGVKVSAETWHRDESITKEFSKKSWKIIPDKNEGILESDLTFGGWQNFDLVNQYFSCVIDTHIIGQRKGEGKGFNRLKDDETANYDEDPRRRHIVVPPGGIIIFNENIVHEVIPITVKDRHIRRSFIGTRLTESDTPMFSDTLDRIERQAPMRLKSGQETAMWPLTAWLYTKQRENLVEWSNRTFVDEVIEEKVFKPGKPEEEKLNIVARYMKGLSDYGLPLYDKYSDEEKAICLPNTDWHILLPGDEENAGDLSLHK